MINAELLEKKIYFEKKIKELQETKDSYIKKEVEELITKLNKQINDEIFKYEQYVLALNVAINNDIVNDKPKIVISKEEDKETIVQEIESIEKKVIEEFNYKINESNNIIKNNNTNNRRAGMRVITNPVRGRR